jgi:hypothetical protein
MGCFGIVESGPVSGNYDSGGGRSDANCIQFGRHREHGLLRLERSAGDRRIGNDCLF